VISRLAISPETGYVFRTMKKLLLCSVVAAFACVSLQAGETAACDKSKASTCSAANACSAAKKVTKASTSVKGATLLVAKR